MNNFRHLKIQIITNQSSFPVVSGYLFIYSFILALIYVFILTLVIKPSSHFHFCVLAETDN